MRTAVGRLRHDEWDGMLQHAVDVRTNEYVGTFEQLFLGHGIRLRMHEAECLAQFPQRLLIPLTCITGELTDQNDELQLTGHLKPVTHPLAVDLFARVVHTQQAIAPHEVEHIIYGTHLGESERQVVEPCALVLTCNEVGAVWESMLDM